MIGKNIWGPARPARRPDLFEKTPHRVKVNGKADAAAIASRSAPPSFNSYSYFILIRLCAITLNRLSIRGNDQTMFFTQTFYFNVFFNWNRSDHLLNQ